MLAGICAGPGNDAIPGVRKKASASFLKKRSKKLSVTVGVGDDGG
jgi:hypothetical protein